MDVDKLLSEQRNPNTMNLDKCSTLELLYSFNDEDQKVALAVREVIPMIARLVDRVSEALQEGGRLIYVGAGTSGRLGVLDASECQPTFGVASDRIIALMAGGIRALTDAIEGAEDSESLAVLELEKLHITSKDVVVGITASGKTPYVMAGLAYAREKGSFTGGITCNPDSLMASIALLTIVPIVGPEVLTGSTRMKAGTAQKLVLNMLTTGAMVKLGKVYQNLMVDLKVTNEKLLDRAERMVMTVAGASRMEAEALLRRTEYAVKPAIVMHLKNVSVDEARRRLEMCNGYLRLAIESD